MVAEATGASALVVAVGLGVVAANVGVLGAWSRPGLQFAARRVLRAGVVLLGFRLSLAEVAELGAPALVVVLAVVALTFVGARLLGARLGLSPALALLVACGFAICGASAVAAANGVIEADEADVAYAVALVTLCGTLSIVVLPLLRAPLGLVDPAAFGQFVGASVHDVAQVVATAATGGPQALEAAVVVKLSRVALLAPLVAGLAVVRRRSTAPTGGGARPAPVPLFLALFGLAVAVRTTGVLDEPALDGLRTAETLAMSAALFGLGAGVRLGVLRAVGGRPLALGLATWAVVAVVAWAGVRLVA